jgi:membrane-bound lytic murein transglycosylase D
MYRYFLALTSIILIIGCASKNVHRVPVDELIHLTPAEDSLLLNGNAETPAASEPDSLYLFIDSLLEYQAVLYNRIDSLEMELKIYQSIPVTAESFEIPDKYNFAGYEIDLKNNRTSERFARIFRNELRAAQRFIPLSGRYFFHFEKVFKEYGIHDDIKYLSIAESMLNPGATSHAGAGGIWQFMPGTAKGYGLVINDFIDERRDIFKSTEAAAKLLRDNHRTLLNAGIDDWLLAMCAYNAGAGNVLRDARSQGATNFFDLIMRAEETDHYVYRSIAIKMIFDHQKQLFGRELELMEPFEEIYKEVNLTMKGHHELNEWAKAQGTTVAKIHEINPWIRIYRQQRARYTPINKVVLPPGTYRILLPRESEPDIRLLAEAEKKLMNAASSHLTEYTVKSGDNLGSIARRHGTTVNHIKLLNNLSSDRIRIGQKLRMAGSVSQSGGSAVQAAVPTEGSVTHKIAPGETLSGIAIKHGVSVDDLRSWNNLRGDNIRAGQDLVVKPGETTYTVKSGDNLSTIARRFGTSVARIRRDNNLSTDLLSVGQRLIIKK